MLLIVKFLPFSLCCSLVSPSECGMRFNFFRFRPELIFSRIKKFMQKTRATIFSCASIFRGEGNFDIRRRNISKVFIAKSCTTSVKMENSTKSIKLINFKQVKPISLEEMREVFKKVEKLPEKSKASSIHLDTNELITPKDDGKPRSHFELLEETHQVALPRLLSLMEKYRKNSFITVGMSSRPVDRDVYYNQHPDYIRRDSFVPKMKIEDQILSAQETSLTCWWSNTCFNFILLRVYGRNTSSVAQTLNVVCFHTCQILNPSRRIITFMQNLASNHAHLASRPRREMESRAWAFRCPHKQHFKWFLSLIKFELH